MKTLRRAVLLTAALICCAPTAATAGDGISISSPVDGVTAYRGRTQRVYAYIDRPPSLGDIQRIEVRWHNFWTAQYYSYFYTWDPAKTPNWFVADVPVPTTIQLPNFDAGIEEYEIHVMGLWWCTYCTPPRWQVQTNDLVRYVTLRPF